LGREDPNLGIIRSEGFHHVQVMSPASMAREAMPENFTLLIAARK
jgi:hypothetical protein